MFLFRVASMVLLHLYRETQHISRKASDISAWVSGFLPFFCLGILGNEQPLYVAVSSFFLMSCLFFFFGFVFLGFFFCLHRLRTAQPTWQSWICPLPVPFSESSGDHAAAKTQRVPGNQWNQCNHTFGPKRSAPHHVSPV